MKARLYKRTFRYVAFMSSIVTITMLSCIHLISPCFTAYTLHDILKLYANNSVFTTAFKQFCALYFSIAIEIKEIMKTNNYHMSNTARGSASNKNHQFCVGCVTIMILMRLYVRLCASVQVNYCTFPA